MFTDYYTWHVTVQHCHCHCHFLSRVCPSHGEDAKIHGVCSGSMNKVLRNWDEVSFHVYNFGYAENYVIKSLLGEYVPPNNPPICTGLQKILGKGVAVRCRAS